MTRRNEIGIYAGSESSWAFIRTALAPYAVYGLKPRLVTRSDILEGDILNPLTTPLACLFLMGGRNNKRLKSGKRRQPRSSRRRKKPRRPKRPRLRKK